MISVRLGKLQKGLHYLTNSKTNECFFFSKGIPFAVYKTDGNKLYYSYNCMNEDHLKYIESRYKSANFEGLNDTEFQEKFL